MTRKTISIDDGVEATLRDIQSKFIKADSRSWSLSKIVNLVLLCAMVKSKDLSISDWNQIRSYIRRGKADLAPTDTETFVENILIPELH